jgi:hypothetical protein
MELRGDRWSFLHSLKNLEPIELVVNIIRFTPATAVAFNRSLGSAGRPSVG